VVKSGNTLFQVNRGHRICDDCVLERSLAGSAAATDSALRRISKLCRYLCFLGEGMRIRAKLT
ncbi:hypothetical protein, partial [Pseudomonas fluorescens]|uniref:hypothetical protein n=1 Tax=Pseudomonas fluorescens TaxID=294 RepID=UPI001CD432AC